MIEKTVACINHLFTPRSRIEKEGVGDCRYCVPDPINNPNCREYQEVTLRIVHITIEGDTRQIYALDSIDERRIN